MIFGKIICKISLYSIIAKQFKKRFFTYFDKKYDDIYIIVMAASGEAYMTLTYFIDALIRKNRSKNPLLVATKRYHLEIIKVLCPEIPHIYIENLNYKFNYVRRKEFKIEPFRFFIFYDMCFFLKFVEQKNDYYKMIQKHLELTDDDLSYKKVMIPPEDEQSMLNKITQTGLNLDRLSF